MKLRLALLRAVFSRNPIATTELIRFWFWPTEVAQTVAAPALGPDAATTNEEE